MTHTISSFRGYHRFLSNFVPAKVILDRVTYPTVEHAYQAAKTLNGADRQIIKNLPSPGQAKRFGKHVELRSDWDAVKIGVMRDLLVQKFREPVMRRKLLNTGTAKLIEGNSWGDTFWGVCNGEGANNLGRLLMEIRDSIREEETPRHSHR